MYIYIYKCIYMIFIQVRRNHLEYRRNVTEALPCCKGSCGRGGWPYTSP